MSKYSVKFIWTNSTGAGRNRYALFRHRFTLRHPARTGTLHLFADTRYRLFVNGQLLGHGPARFFLEKPEHDSYELAPFLQEGVNTIAVMVNSYGGSSFHSQESRGGLMAWGSVRDVARQTLSIGSDESWKAIDSPGHHPDTAALSFALNPGEHLDLGKMPAGWEQPQFDDSTWPRAVAVAHPEHWGRLSPRSIPMLDERRVLPQRRLGAFAARPIADEDVYSLFVSAPNRDPSAPGGKIALFTFIHSPRDQQVTFGAWWGRYWVNGQELQPTRKRNEHLRQEFTADLKQGWNTFFMFESLRHDWWDFYLGLPKSAGLEVSPEKQTGSPNGFLVGGPWEGVLAEQAAAMALPVPGPEELPKTLGPWWSSPRAAGAHTPARQRAWKTFERIDNGTSLAVSAPALLGQRRVAGAEALRSPGIDRSAPQRRGFEDDVRGSAPGPPATGGPPPSLALLYDFGTEVLGRPVIDFTAAVGTTVDLSYTERLKPDGVADVHGRFFVDMVERCVARAGRQRWHAFHPRGFRYLEVLVTGDVRAFELHELSATRANYPVQSLGQFECSDARLSAIWKLGRDTQYACMEDAYLDCPGRERGLYVGDMLVQFFVNLAAFGDTKLFRRCLDLFLLAQGDGNGLVPAGAHGLPAGRHPDYSALIPQLLWHYWARTGDVRFLRGNNLQLLKLVRGLEMLRPQGADESSDLLDGSNLSPYVDLSPNDKSGVCCALNCFYHSAFDYAARVFELTGDADLAAYYRDRAGKLAEAVRREFWDEARGVFVDRLKRDVPDTGPSVPANALALLHDIASPEQAPRAVAWLVEAMERNFRVPDPKDNRDCNVTAYFAWYALGALYRHGKGLEAERFMRSHWGRMLDQGAWTCWEYFVDAGASRCHAWSACPTHYLTSMVLGVTFPQPGNVNVVKIAPQPGTMTWARGVYPHPAGLLRVEWRVEGGKLQVKHELPKGVTVAG